MLDLSGISNRSLLGKALRLPLRLVPDSMQVPIVQGPLRGKRWIAGSSNHGCWLGSYECQKQTRIAGVVKPGMICYDIGANVGFYTLLLSELVGGKGTVVAFEPVPRNCELLRRHISMNTIANVFVRELALADFDGQASFNTSDSHTQGHLSPGGALSVSCARIDTLLAAGDIKSPDFIKIDVEGAEAAVLQGAAALLSRCRPVIFFATHGEGPKTECCRILERLGYTLDDICGAPVQGSDELVAIPV